VRRLPPVAEDELMLVAPLTHPWATRILREPGSGTRSVFEGALPGLGLTGKDLNVALVLPLNEAVRAAVEAGAGVTMISRLVVASSIKTGDLVPVNFLLCIAASSPSTQGAIRQPRGAGIS
jgi:DNA-binding transcriptional LysR family regulator